jgi:hypothetical protein
MGGHLEFSKANLHLMTNTHIQRPGKAIINKLASTINDCGEGMNASRITPINFQLERGKNNTSNGTHRTNYFKIIDNKFSNNLINILSHVPRILTRKKQHPNRCFFPILDSKPIFYFIFIMYQ